jgi:hypothetical protein
MSDKYSIVISEDNEKITTRVSGIFSSIRESWKTRDLIDRTQKLLLVDPSSACQKIFNASISDLREKIIVAGIDIAKNVIDNSNLPKITKEDDVYDYRVRHLIDLAYHMGILSRENWKRMQRAYDIRNDLEHEDSTYIANESDTIYIFQTCIDSVLSKDPIRIIKVSDVKVLIESEETVSVDDILLEDYKTALIARQQEIMKMLISVVMDPGKPDVIRQNAFSVLKIFNQYTHNDVRLYLANFFQSRSRNLSNLSARVFYAAGIFGYTDIIVRKHFFSEILRNMDEIGFSWEKNIYHREVLSIFYEIGFLNYCPQEILLNIATWLVKCYIGEKGGYGYYGRGRSVFYSNTGAKLSKEILMHSAKNLAGIMNQIIKDKWIAKSIKDSNVKLRMDNLFDELNGVITSSENAMFID